MAPPISMLGMSGPISSLISSSGGAKADPGQQIFYSGTTNFTVPEARGKIGVRSVAPISIPL